MKKVRITNIINNRTFGATMEDPTSWIDLCTANNSWGLPARQVPKKGMGYDNEVNYADILVVSEFEKEVAEATTRDVFAVDGNGDIIYQDEDSLDMDNNPIVIKVPVVDHTEPVPAVFQTWVNLKAEYEIVEVDITTEYETKQALDAEIEVGKQIDNYSTMVLSLIAGHNVNNSVPKEEIDQMKVDFASAFNYLKDGQLFSAKIEILAITDPTYAVLKAKVLLLYSMWGY